MDERQARAAGPAGPVRVERLVFACVAGAIAVDVALRRRDADAEVGQAVRVCRVCNLERPALHLVQGVEEPEADGMGGARRLRFEIPVRDFKRGPRRLFRDVCDFDAVYRRRFVV